jgi:predicted HD superfamily hydrolase involved in NAD metabolism
MNFDIDHYTAFAKRELTPERFEHSFGVMQVMDELSPIYALDHATALTCGILHDAAKELAIVDQLALVEKGNILLTTECDRHAMFLHGPAGACYISQELGVEDPLILDTISRHSYFGRGVAVSPVFCWCLRFADILEPKRDWKDLQRQLGALVYSGKMKEGAYLLTKWMIPFLGTKSIPVHPNMHRILKELSALMDEENACEADNLPV